MDDDSVNSLTYSNIIQVFFKNPRFYPFILQQQLTTLDFVSYCGGSLGLFLGFSTLSAIEIIYYFTLRLMCFKNSRKKVRCAESNDPPKQRNYMISFMESSSIHGLNQIVMKNRHITEK
jgi:hypothetical protein